MGRRKKGLLAFVMVWMLTMTLSGPLPVHAEDEDIRVLVNGRPVSFDEVGPRYANARVMVPVAPFCAALGAQVVWDAASQEVFIYLYDRYVWLQSTNKTLYYGDYAVAADGSGIVYLTSVTPMPLTLRPDLTEGRLVAPMSSLVTALNATVLWDGETETAFVTKPSYAPTRYYEDVRETTGAAATATASVEAITNNTADASIIDTGTASVDDAVYTPPSYFQLISADDALAKYTAVDPFIVICYNGTYTKPEVLREAQRAAADQQTKVYGLDMAENTTDLPFMTQHMTQLLTQPTGKDNIAVYFLTDTGRVTALTTPDYDVVVTGIQAYWESD